MPLTGVAVVVVPLPRVSVVVVTPVAGGRRASGALERAVLSTAALGRETGGRGRVASAEAAVALRRVSAVAALGLEARAMLRWLVALLGSMVTLLRLEAALLLLTIASATVRALVVLLVARLLLMAAVPAVPAAALVLTSVAS